MALSTLGPLTGAEDGFFDDGYCVAPGPVEIAEPQPVFTGLYNAHGQPIYRHPQVLRVGFHPPERATWVPTLEDDDFDDGPITGWVYAT